MLADHNETYTLKKAERFKRWKFTGCMRNYMNQASGIGKGRLHSSSLDIRHCSMLVLMRKCLNQSLL